MNAEDFYEEFKQALKFLDVPWGEKELVTVDVRYGRFVMAYDGRDVSFKVSAESTKTQPERPIS